MGLDNLNNEAVELLENYCSFVIGAKPSGLRMLPESDGLKLIAGDGMGGCFYEWHIDGSEESAIVYLTQYGETSRIANNIEEIITLVINCEEWCDALTAAHKSKDITERVINDKRYDEEWKESSDRLKEIIPIENIDLVEMLLDVVNAEPKFCPQLLSEDGLSSARSFKERPYPA